VYSCLFYFILSYLFIQLLGTIVFVSIATVSGELKINDCRKPYRKIRKYLSAL